MLNTVQNSLHLVLLSRFLSCSTSVTPLRGCRKSMRIAGEFDQSKKAIVGAIWKNDRKLGSLMIAKTNLPFDASLSLAAYVF